MYDDQREERLPFTSKGIVPAGATGLYTSHLYLHFVTIPEDLTKENLVDVNEELTHWLKTMNYPRNKENVQTVTEEVMELGLWASVAHACDNGEPQGYPRRDGSFRREGC